MEKNQNQNANFQNLLAVLPWLKKNGWKISRAGLYKHRAEGKIRQQVDGTYTRKNIERYARTFLKRKATGRRLRDGIDDLQHRKTGLEVEKLKEEVARAKRRREVEEGAFIPLDEFEVEMVARATVLDAGLSHLFQSQAAAWIQLVGGSPQKLSELIGVLVAAKNNLLNQYARRQEFLVEIGEKTGGK